jgi:hypothetical protein
LPQFGTNRHKSGQVFLGARRLTTDTAVSGFRARKMSTLAKIALALRQRGNAHHQGGDSDARALELYAVSETSNFVPIQPIACYRQA